MFLGTFRIQPSQVLPRLRESNMHQARFVTRPSGSSTAVADLQVRKVRTRIRPSVATRVPPERQPLSGMIIADSLHGAHAGEGHSPDRHERQMAFAGSQCGADPFGAERAQKSGPRDSVDSFDGQIQNWDLQELVIERRYACAAQ